MTRMNQLTVLYDADCGVCSHVAKTLYRADARGLLNLVSLQVANLTDSPPQADLLRTLHARAADGQWFTGGAASVEIARRVPILWPLSLYAKLPLSMTVLDLMYRVFADNRHTISRALGLKACKVPQRGAHSTDAIRQQAGGREDRHEIRRPAF